MKETVTQKLSDRHSGRCELQSSYKQTIPTGTHGKN